ncbi:MAG: CBS domain-containing protein [Methyloprofundus sp.]|nr:CBS domain-containing protein [Methyloprofundus sp.]
MKLLPLLQAFTVDPVQLNIKAKALSLLACFCAIFFIAIITQAVIGTSNAPIIVASMGASAVILFFIPNSPLAQPWPFAGGQLCSAFIGISCALNISETASAAATAVGLSVLVMLLLRCLHPPAAATALAPVMAGDSITSLGYSFMLVPVGINLGFMLILTVIINRWILNRNYPSALAIKEVEKNQPQSATAASPNAAHKIGITKQDIELALKNSNSFVDITATELSHLLSNAELNTFKRVRDDICCADIMVRDLTSVEYGTEVEDAWQLIQEKKLKVIPVVDNVNRVIGIITWHDFFKYINLNAYDSLQDQFRRFIRRTANIETNKPEAVGHIMTQSVVTLPETAHIVELIPLMSLQGHRQIPIINKEHRLVGIVYQANLVAALYNQGLAKAL